jgi:O-antigen ligase
VLLVLLALFGRLPVVDQLAVEGRAVAFFKDPNVFGPFLIPVALYAILQVSVERGVRRRLPWALVVTLASVGVLLSLSRAAWGSYALGALTYTLFAFPGSRGLGRRMAVLGLIGLASLLPVWRLAGDEYGELLFSRIGLQPYDDDRFATHSAAAATSLAAWYGIGPGQAETVFDYATHSLYLRVLAENGWISALAFGAFLLATLARSIRGLQDRTGWRPYFAFCTATLTSVLFNSLFIDSLHWRHFWLVCALPWIPYETTSPHHAR